MKIDTRRARAVKAMLDAAMADYAKTVSETWPRRSEPWQRAEDQKLLRLYDEGVIFREGKDAPLNGRKHFGRTECGVQARLRMLLKAREYGGAP